MKGTGRSFPRGIPDRLRPGSRTALLLILAVPVLAAAALVLSVSPSETVRRQAQSWVSDKLEQPVRLKMLTWGWRGGPFLRARDVRIGGKGLRIRELGLQVRPWALLQGELELAGAELRGLDLTLRRDEQGRLWIGHFRVKTERNRVLSRIARLDHFRVREGTLTWIDETTPEGSSVTLREWRVTLRRKEGGFQVQAEGLSGGGRVEAEGRIGDLEAGPEEWRLDVRTRAADLPVSPLLPYLGPSAPDDLGNRLGWRAELNGSYQGKLRAEGRLRLESGTVVWPAYLPGPLKDLSAKTRFRVRTGEGRGRLVLQEGRLGIGDLSAAGGASLHWGEGAPGPRFRGRLDVRKTDLKAFKPLLEGGESAPPGAGWISRAVKRGRLKGAQIRIRAPISRLPFPGERGKLRVEARFEGIHLAYHPDWPDLRSLSGKLLLEDGKLAFQVGGGKILGAPVRKITGSVRDLAGPSPVLRLNGDIDFGLGRGVRFLERSPLAEPGFLDPLEASGPVRLRLALEVPLSRGGKPSASGEVDLKGATLSGLAGMPGLKSIRGAVAFQDGRVRGKDLRGRWLGEEVGLGIERIPQGDIRCSLAGTFRASALREVMRSTGLSHPLAGRLKGALPLRGRAFLGSGEERINLKADLTEAAIDLPEPLGKAPGEPGKARIHVRGTGPLRVNGTVSLPEHQLRMAFREVGNGKARYGLALGLGREAPEVRWNRWRLAGEVPKLRVGPWWELARGLVPDRESGPVPGMEAELRVQTLLWGEAALDRAEVDLRGEAGEEGYRVAGRIAAKTGEGQIEWIHRRAKRDRLRLDLERLELTGPEGWPEGGVSSGPSRSEGSRTTAPRLDLRLGVRQLRVGDQRFRALRVRAGLGPGQWHLHRLSAEKGDSRLRLRGNWIADLSRSLVRVDMETGDFGGLLRGLGIYPSMKGGSGTLEGTITWPGMPTAFGADRLSGSLRLRVADGEIEDFYFLSKALGTLNVLEWPSQAAQGFQTLTHSGLVYRKIQGRAIIRDGVARIRDFRLESAPLRLEAFGKMNLGKGSYDLLFRLEPLQTMDRVVSAVPLLGYLLTGGEEGSLGAVHYSVQGPWGDPRVEAFANPREETPWATLWRRLGDMGWKDLLPWP